MVGEGHALGTTARTHGHRKKDGFPRRPVGPSRNDKGSGLSLRGAKRRGNPHPPSPRLPCVKGAVSRRLTEGLSGVAGHFGDDLCSDSYPPLATAPQTLRCAPLARVVVETFDSRVGGGLRPAPQGKASFPANSRWFPNTPHRVRDGPTNPGKPPGCRSVPTTFRNHLQK